MCQKCGFCVKNPHFSVPWAGVFFFAVKCPALGRDLGLLSSVGLPKTHQCPNRLNWQKVCLGRRGRPAGGAQRVRTHAVEMLPFRIKKWSIYRGGGAPQGGPPSWGSQEGVPGTPVGGPKTGPKVVSGWFLRV